MMTEGALFLIGAHTSAAGGVSRAVERAAEYGSTALALFLKNQRQWAAPPLEREEVARFRRAIRETGIDPRALVAHDTYLVNLASGDGAVRRRSKGELREEVKRAKALGVRALVMHPGSATAGPRATGLRRIADGVKRLLGQWRELEVLLETTAGQGTSLGSSFEEIAEIISLAGGSRRIGVCYDTAHCFAAGYDIRRRPAYERTMAEFDRAVGLDRIKAFHLNDTRVELGSRVDRHWHIGRASLGRNAFRLVVTDPRFAGVPKIIETPKRDEDCDDWDAVNLAELWRLAKRKLPEPLARRLARLKQ
jgi:deoxyribonuclease-4